MSIQRKMGVIGMGLVGLTTALAFARHTLILGFDIDSLRINELKKGVDRNKLITKKKLRNANINLSTNPDDLEKIDFYIISVPTLVDALKQPDYNSLFEATKLIAKYLKKGDVVVYESTVEPGITEKKCIPLLEKISNLTCGIDFSVGYSPERINPGDKKHSYEKLVKIVAAENAPGLNIISSVFNEVIKAGVCRVSNIKTAEAIKIIENTQRDMNIAFANEAAMLLHQLNIDVAEVFSAAKTKWNFVPCKPGLVGGHCIGVNSYFLLQKAKESHFHADMIAAGRAANEKMVHYVAEETIRQLKLLNVEIHHAKVAILGLTYKPNYADIHDSRVIELINLLQKKGANILIHDPLVDTQISKRELGIGLSYWKKIKACDAVIFAVEHQAYKKIIKKKILSLFKKRGVCIDLTETLPQSFFANSEIILWKL